MIEYLTAQQQLLYIILPLCVLYGLFFYFRFKSTPSISSSVLRPWALIVFILGVVLYAIGFNHGASSKSLLAMILRPIMASLELFVSHSSFRELSIECQESPLFVTLFSWVQFNALFVSASFFFSLLGSRIISKILDVTEYLFARKHINKLYVFWGLDDNAVLLAKSIYARMEKERKEKGIISKIAIIVLPLEETRSKGRMNFSKIFSSLDYDSSRLEKISYIKNETILFANNDIYEDNCDFIKLKGVGRLSRLIRRSGIVKVFFMSENEKQNITSADLFVSSPAIKKRFETSNGNKHFKLKVYCQACRKADNLIQEKVISMYHQIDISLIDSAYLAVLSMKVALKFSEYVCPDSIYQEHLTHPSNSKIHEYINHPINYVDHNNGVVTSKFSSMIIGFGETGQYALDFLYEFGAFSDANGGKAQFNCCIYDDNMDKLWPHYKQRVPILKDANISREIEHFNYSPNSEQFWNDFSEKLDSLNYIVICMGNDADTMSVLGEVYNEITHNRKNGFGRIGSEKLHICIRAYNEENEELIKKTIKAYNELAGEEVVRYFGMASKIYTIEKIDDEELGSLASLIDTVYSNMQKRTYPIEGITTNSTTINNSFLNFEKEYKFQEKRRKEYANKEQGLHLYTKKILLGTNPSEEVIENVAKGEHYRWCASHFMQGYLPMTEEQKKTMPQKPDGSIVTCSERLKRHACLVHYNSLTKTEQEFDKAFVYAALDFLK